ncbi:MAG: protein kinase [Myxococcota bacterium]|nr:protein kinase [Myxococcota bacterium]
MIDKFPLSLKLCYTEDAVTVGRKSCPKCGGVYPSNAEFCALDGERLRSGDEDILIGRTIGRYEIVNQVGQGGMARLYRAKHKFLPQEFAIKFLFGEFAANPQIVTRFQREAQAVSKIKHPNIVQTVDFGQTDEGLPFMVMEFIEGASLSQYIAAHHPLPLTVIADLAKQLSSGLHAAHDEGFVHRDLKPGNVMISERPEGLHATILDFGLVHLKEQPDEDVNKLTRSGQILGTPAYMSPEQIDGTGVSAKTDLYALGIVIHELITGRAPFSGSMSSVMNQHLFESAPELPKAGGLESIALQLLQKHPDDRPADAQTVYTLIDQLIQSKSLENAEKEERASARTTPGKVQETTHRGRPETSETQFDLPSVSEPVNSRLFPILVLVLICGALVAGLLSSQQRDNPTPVAIAPEASPPVAVIRPKEDLKPKTETDALSKRNRKRPSPKKTKRQNSPKVRPENPKVPSTPESSAPVNTEPKTNRPTAKEEADDTSNSLKPSGVPESTDEPKKEPETKITESKEATDTTIEVEVEIEASPSPAKKKANSLGSMAKDFKNKSKNQKRDPEWMKKRLAELEQSSGANTRNADRKQADDYKKSAIDAIGQKRLVRAEIELGFCLELVPKHSDCNKLMGIVREEKGDKKGALKYYRRYLSVTPKAPDRAFIEEKMAKIEREKN